MRISNMALLISLPLALQFIGCSTQNDNQNAKSGSETVQPTPSGDVQTTTTAPSASKKKSIPGAPTQAVSFTIGKVDGAAVVVNAREIRFYLEKSGEYNPNLHTSGTVHLRASDPPLATTGVPDGDYIYVRTQKELVPPVELSMEFQMGSEKYGKTELVIPETSVIRIGATSSPEITSAALNVRVGDDTALLSVQGKNLSNAALFLRSDGQEVEVPVDIHTDDQMALVSRDFEGTIKPGVWDVIVRSPAGEAVLPRAITK